MTIVVVVVLFSLHLNFILFVKATFAWSFSFEIKLFKNLSWLIKEIKLHHVSLLNAKSYFDDTRCAWHSNSHLWTNETFGSRVLLSHILDFLGTPHWICKWFSAAGQAGFNRFRKDRVKLYRLTFFLRASRDSNSRRASLIWICLGTSGMRKVRMNLKASSPCWNHTITNTSQEL